MDNTEWNFPSDDEIHDSRQKSGGQGDRVFITSLRADTPQVYYFLSLPGEDKRDWINFRELNTREGLKVGPDMPSEMTFGVMVRDFRFVKNEVTGKYAYEYDNNLDPLTAGEPGKQMWQVGARNTDQSGLIRVQWRCGVNVVDAITGYHKVLKMSLSAKEDLKKYFEVKNEDGDFDVQGRPYEVLYTGEGFKWNLAIRPVRPGSSIIRDGKSVEIPPRIDLPEMIDVRTVLIEQRELMDEFIGSLPTRSGRPVDTSNAPDFVQEAMERPEDTTDLPGGIDLFRGEEQSAKGDLSEKYLAMSPARLRSLLSKAKVDVERGAPKETLAALAAEHIG